MHDATKHWHNAKSEVGNKQLLLKKVSPTLLQFFVNFLTVPVCLFNFQTNSDHLPYQ